MWLYCLSLHQGDLIKKIKNRNVHANESVHRLRQIPGGGGAGGWTVSALSSVLVTARKTDLEQESLVQGAWLCSTCSFCLVFWGLSQCQIVMWFLAAATSHLSAPASAAGAMNNPSSVLYSSGSVNLQSGSMKASDWR